MARAGTSWQASAKKFAILFTALSMLLNSHSLVAIAQSAGVTVSKTVASPTEAGTADSFTVVLDSQPATSVTFSVTNSAPTQLTVSSLYLTFTNANWDTAQTVTLTATNDTVADETTSATVTLSVLDATSDDAFDSVPDTVVNVTVVDDDFCGPKVVESNGSTGVTEAATTDTFTVALGAQPTTDVVISVGSGDTTEATVSTAQLTFTNANWSTAQTVTVTGVNDSEGDGNQTPAVTLAIVDASSDNCFDSAADTIVSVRVSDDDSAGLTVVETGGSIAVTEASTVATATTVGNTDTFTVVLNKAPTTNVVVNVTSSDTTEATVSIAQLTFTNANWSTA